MTYSQSKLETRNSKLETRNSKEYEAKFSFVKSRIERFSLFYQNNSLFLFNLNLILILILILVLFNINFLLLKNISQIGKEDFFAENCSSWNNFGVAKIKITQGDVYEKEMEDDWDYHHGDDNRIDGGRM
jgi:hypothetical protein